MSSSPVSNGSARSPFIADSGAPEHRPRPSWKRVRRRTMIDKRAAASVSEADNIGGTTHAAGTDPGHQLSAADGRRHHQAGQPLYRHRGLDRARAGQPAAQPRKAGRQAAGPGQGRRSLRVLCGPLPADTAGEGAPGQDRRRLRDAAPTQGGSHSTTPWPSSAAFPTCSRSSPTTTGRKTSATASPKRRNPTNMDTCRRTWDAVTYSAWWNNGSPFRDWMRRRSRPSPWKTSCEWPTVFSAAATN